MNEWPAGWFREQKPGGAPGAAGGSPGARAQPSPRMQGGGQAGATGPMSAMSAWPSQPPARDYGGGTAAPPTPARGPLSGGFRGGPRPRRRHRWPKVIGLLVVVVLILLVAGYFYLDSQLHRQNVLADYSSRPAAGAGSNWLITGSDSRQGLSRWQESHYSTGHDVSGRRSDTVMVLHMPANGEPPVLVSIPRDSYVPIPGNGWNKINAAYSFGGPKLLAQTVQNATGLRIDHYMSIGFGGLVRVVNAVGGVRMCFKTAVQDSYSGLHLKPGCHTLSGGQALSFVRDRHSFGTSDLQRVQDQRIFMAALLRKLTSPGTMLNPFSSIPAAFGAAGVLTVDRGTHLYQLMQVAFALRHPKTTTVPISGSVFTPAAGDALQWDHAQASQLFNDLNNDRHLPKSLLTGSKLG